MKVLYIYSGERKNRFSGDISKDYPDTQFYGLNHLKKFGIEAEYKEPSRVLRKIFGFRIAHMFMFFYVSDYDVVFGSSLLYMLFWSKLFKSKTKYVLLNISLNRTISANKNRKLKKAFLVWLLKELDAIVCLSIYQKIFLEKETPFMNNKIFFIPLGVDISYHKPDFYDRDNFILSVGRDNGRDYKTVIEVARLMPKERFHIVASKRNFKNIKDIPDNVELFFDIPFKKLRKKYKKAKMLLLITKADNYSDGADCSGQTVLLDAMASGLPVIASRKKYMEDYTEDGKDIMLVDFYSKDDIVDKINSLNTRSVMEDIVKKARDKVEKKFSTETMAKNLSDVFLSLS